MQVLKFGGSSVADAAMINLVHDITVRALNDDRTILVSSAVSGCTDTLIDIGHRAARRDPSYKDLLQSLRDRHLEIASALLPGSWNDAVAAELGDLFDSLGSIVRGINLVGELSNASLEAVQSYGELFSTRILAALFPSRDIACKWLDSRNLVRVKGGHVDLQETYSLIEKAIDDNAHVNLFIAPGFIAADACGRVVTLGRGGSDYSASLFAVGSRARKVEIWTDVSGIMTANPRVVPSARPVPNLSYRAAQELSHFGAKVIYPPTIQPVIEEGIPIYVKNTFRPDDPGSLVEKNPPRSNASITGISNSDKIALISLEGSGMVGVPGFSARLFDALWRSGVNIILITQASSVHTMCIAVSEQDALKAKEAADECFAYEISLGKLNPLKVEKGYSIVCLVGDDILGHSGATGRMLSALGRAGIPVRATAQGSSERNISVIVSSARVNEAIRAIHAEFFDAPEAPYINVFLAGKGRIGGALLSMLSKGAGTVDGLRDRRVRLCGISDSKRFVINTEGLDPGTAVEALKEGLPATDGGYFEALAPLLMSNSVFVDCTADPGMASCYPMLFASGYSVVSCNKLPFSGPFARYKTLLAEARRNDVSLLFETTVGAALPVLSILDGIAASDDTLKKVEAALSGTLNYLLDSYKGSEFAALVEDARKRGYTEPDPSEDLSGADVRRKLVILARRAGIPLEQSDVLLEPVPSEDVLEGLFKAAEASGKRLRYVASVSYENGSWKASAAVRAVGEENPLFNLHGTNNMVSVTTDDYPSSIVVSGAGAGARQTAGGVLHDILLA